MYSYISRSSLKTMYHIQSLVQTAAVNYNRVSHKTNHASLQQTYRHPASSGTQDKKMQPDTWKCQPPPQIHRGYCETNWAVTCRPWWRHQMETFSALLALCAGNSPVTGEFPAQRPVTRSFDIVFDLCLNNGLSKQWRYAGSYDIFHSCCTECEKGREGVFHQRSSKSRKLYENVMCSSCVIWQYQSDDIYIYLHSLVLAGIMEVLRLTLHFCQIGFGFTVQFLVRYGCVETNICRLNIEASLADGFSKTPFSKLFQHSKPERVERHAIQNWFWQWYKLSHPKRDVCLPLVVFLL